MQQLGNLYHHWLLAGLRAPAIAGGAATKKYEVPRGGFFNLVTCPHYLFEVRARLMHGI